MEDKIKYIIAKNYASGEPRRIREYLLYQVGRRYCAASSEVSVHGQGKYIELTVVTDGRGRVYFDGEEREVSRGDIQISLPGEMHAIYSDGDEPLCYDFISFWNDGEREGKMSDDVAYCRAKGQRIIKDSRISRLLTYVIDEIDGELDDEELIFHLLGLIYGYLSRSLREGAESEERRVSEAEQICYRAMSYIDRNVGSICSLSEVATALRYNYSYLSLLFKKTTGRTLMEYYTERRLAAADALLRSGRNVTEVAARLGYSSLYTFSRAYRNSFGYPPSRAIKEGDRL